VHLDLDVLNPDAVGQAKEFAPKEGLLIDRDERVWKAGIEFTRLVSN